MKANQSNGGAESSAVASSGRQEQLMSLICHLRLSAIDSSRSSFSCAVITNYLERNRKRAAPRIYWSSRLVVATCWRDMGGARVGLQTALATASHCPVSDVCTVHCDVCEP